ncbi:hypothetical protein PDO_5086 [Rhizobium sp. PDO1-076]|uniref:hypothetical protein n=1 Tax=Rhizobium sp. PDO1-076 TaxID=1125979 RepID=UPI00024E2D0F|nr:hypothetical protein [Rhizobium sp. PDO1-076]EHS51696.1 hypothetical protein PDO_5086 [Rhizobium sp. PDO1-076]
MLKNDPPECERKLADLALLRALLHRSSYSSAGLRAQSGGNYAREVVIIDRLRKGMVMSDMQAAVWETVVFSHATALSRWEGEGGSPCGRDQVATTVRSGG